MCSTLFIVDMIGLVNNISFTSDTHKDFAKLSVQKLPKDSSR